MSEIATLRIWPRSMGAVFAGLLTNIVPALVIDAALHATAIYPPMGQPMSTAHYVLASSYRILLAIAGGYLTGRLAPTNPLKHSFILGVIGFVLATTGAVVMWDAGPAWYPLLLIIIAIPCSLLGGRMSLRYERITPLL